MMELGATLFSTRLSNAFTAISVLTNDPSLPIKAFLSDVRQNPLESVLTFASGLVVA